MAHSCPLCLSEKSDIAFPYAIKFADVIYSYYRCLCCRTVYIDPIPNDSAFKLIYSKELYHDAHYSLIDRHPYHKSAALLAKFAASGSSVLDYGCGVGHFLAATKELGFRSCGVEYDSDAADYASSSIGCPVFSVSQFKCQNYYHSFDVLHLGDVLEHLPNPISTLALLLTTLKPGGILFVEGPLETNPSPVYWAARLVGTVKHCLNSSNIGTGVPAHLFLTSASAQSDFFQKQFPALHPLFWSVSETGWPYASGNWIKRRVADLAVALGGKGFAGVQLGNRFQAIYRNCV